MFKKNPLIQRFSSIKITVVCLFLLFILTFWGTIDQVNSGLYHAQKQFFHSWIFLGFGFLPFPGAKLVLSVLFINLLCASVTRFVFKINYLGILIIHLGLLIYFFAAYITYKVTVESNVTLLEGEGTNLSSSYHQWELSVWEKTGENTRLVKAYDVEHLKAGQILKFPTFNFQILTKSYYPNAEGYVGENSREIKSLTSVKLNKEPEKNFPGGTFEINSGKNSLPLTLYGKETQPKEIKVGNKFYNVQLRRKRYELPFMITLKDFKMDVHPGTEVARSYESLVTIDYHNSSRDVLIYMNHPLRYKDYTLYQASYSMDQKGREYSTLAVVKNAGRLLPYIACFVTFAGLVIHFLMMAFKSRIKKI